VTGVVMTGRGEEGIGQKENRRMIEGGRNPRNVSALDYGSSCKGRNQNEATRQEKRTLLLRTTRVESCYGKKKKKKTKKKKKKTKKKRKKTNLYVRGRHSASIYPGTPIAHGSCPKKEMNIGRDTQQSPLKRA